LKRSSHMCLNCITITWKNTARSYFTALVAVAFLLLSSQRCEGFGISLLEYRGHTVPLFPYSEQTKLVLRCFTTWSLQNRKSPNYCQTEELRCHKFKILNFTWNVGSEKELCRGGKEGAALPSVPREPRAKGWCLLTLLGRLCSPWSIQTIELLSV